MLFLLFLVFSLKLHVLFIIILDILQEKAYFILAAEIILIALYFVIPILIKKFYTLTPGKDNKDIILQNKIISNEKNLIVIEERILRNLRFDSEMGHFRRR